MIVTELAMSLADGSNPGRTIGFVAGRLIILGAVLFFLVRWLIRLARKPKNQPSRAQYGYAPWPAAYPQAPYPPHGFQPYPPRGGPPQSVLNQDWDPPVDYRNGAAPPNQWVPPTPGPQYSHRAEPTTGPAPSPPSPHRI